MEETKVIPPGYCHCGCGGKTEISSVSNKSKGWIRGQPKRFINYHHIRLQRKSPVPYIVRDDGCWEWQWSTDSSGYGHIRIDGRLRSAHIVFYEKKYGPVPEGKLLDHFFCDNPRCVNPDHVRPATNKENTQRGRCAKLSYEQAEMIRADCRPASALAQELGVSRSLIKMVRQGRVWS